MKLVRDNDDPKLLADLDRLAGREPVVVEPAAEGVDPGEVAEPSPLDDPFVRTFVTASVHLKKYGPFYAGAAVWLLAMLLIHPVGKGDAGAQLADGPGFAGQASPAAAVSAPSAVADLGADAVAAPTFETVTGADFSSSSADFSSADFSSSDTEFAGGDTSSSSSYDDTTDTTISFDDSAFGSDEPKKLTITRSGYASTTGGTPAEQAPANNGLPVAATAGQDTKRSFIALEGEGDQLKMKQTTDGAVQPDTAVIKLCKMTADWKAERGQKLDPSAPTGFDPACSTGSVLDGVWTFDLTPFSTTDREKGLTLTPGAGTALTFQIVFDPVPEPTENA